MALVYEYFLKDETSTLRAGNLLAEVSGGSGFIYLCGDLGTGKTTLSRGVVRYFGYRGAVKSPTFTIVEPYELDHYRIYHFDLYRLTDPEELEFLGVDEYFSQDSLCLVEWPEKGADFLPKPDLVVELKVCNRGRTMKIYPRSTIGKMMMTRFKQSLQLDSETLN